MSYAEIKKAINDDLNTPLNELLLQLIPQKFYFYGDGAASQSFTIPFGCYAKITAIGSGGNGDTGSFGSGGGGGTVIDSRKYITGDIISIGFSSGNTTVTCSRVSLNLGAGAGGNLVSINTKPLGGTATGGNLQNVVGGKGGAYNIGAPENNILSNSGNGTGTGTGQYFGGGASYFGGHGTYNPNDGRGYSGGDGIYGGGRGSNGIINGSSGGNGGNSTLGYGGDGGNATSGIIGSGGNGYIRGGSAGTGTGTAGSVGQTALQLVNFATLKKGVHFGSGGATGTNSGNRIGGIAGVIIELGVSV